MDRSTRFKHVVLTVYFGRQIDDPNDFARRLGNVREWLENRLVLFKRYCLPSVIAQSNQDFTWLLCLDETTPEDYLQKIRDLIAGHDNIKIRLGGLFTPKIHAADVRAELDPDTEWVVTTRLDNDDGWHRDFVKNLHAQLRFDRREFLNFPTGIIYYRDRTYLYRHRSNAFLSFCEPADDFSTVICANHIFASEVAPIRQLSGPPAFLQAVHGRNQSNKPRGIRVHRAMALNGFEAMTELFADPKGERDRDLLFENLTATPARMVRDRMIDMARPVMRRWR
ncbi:MAG: glycosyltransferase [Terracidiphilus sp.]